LVVAFMAALAVFGRLAVWGVCGATKVRADGVLIE